MRLLSSSKQLEYAPLIPLCKDLITGGNVAVDYKIGLFPLEGEVLIFMIMKAPLEYHGRAEL